MENNYFEFGRGKNQTFKKRSRPFNPSDDDQQLILQAKEQQQDDHLDNPIEEQDYIDDMVLGDDNSVDENVSLNSDQDFVPPTLVEVETFAELPYVQEEEMSNLSFNEYVSGATLLQGGKSVINYN